MARPRYVSVMVISTAKGALMLTPTLTLILPYPDPHPTLP